MCIYISRYFVSPSWNNNPLLVHGRNHVRVRSVVILLLELEHRGNGVTRKKEKEGKRKAYVELRIPRKLRARETIIFRAEGQRSFI